MTTPESTDRLRILLVEDEVLNRTLVRAILARAQNPTFRDAELLEAETLAAARAILATEPVDILLLDVHLPDGSGLTLAQDLADNPPARRPVMIALTAGIFPDQQRAAFAAGCITILSKPHTAAEFLAALTPHLPASLATRTAAEKPPDPMVG
jgi:CheY-like chemotaxis protein